MSKNDVLTIRLLFVRIFCLLSIPHHISDSVHGLPQQNFGSDNVESSHSVIEESTGDSSFPTLGSRFTDLDSTFKDLLSKFSIKGTSFTDLESMLSSSGSDSPTLAQPLSIDDLKKNGNWTSKITTTVVKNKQPQTIDGIDDIKNNGNWSSKITTTVVKNKVIYHKGINDRSQQPENSGTSENLEIQQVDEVTTEPELSTTVEIPTRKTMTTSTTTTSSPTTTTTTTTSTTTSTTSRPTTRSSSVVNNPTGDCQKSVTTVNGVPACSQSLIFESNFNQGIDEKWSNEVHFNDDESEFVVFDTNPINCYIDSNYLTIEPTLLDDYYGEYYAFTSSLDITRRCTTNEDELCKREKHVSTMLPPVMSARLTTKDSFSFEYGVVEIRAKLPRGDWVIPEIWLQPKFYKPYGARKSGKIVVAKSIGNRDLRQKGIHMGNNVLNSGLEVDNITQKFKNMRKAGLWSDDFHVYGLEWTKTGIKFNVDGERYGEWFGNRYSPILQEYGPISPFDQEFYLVLGLHVGGYHDIPNGVVSAGQPKPWSNTHPKRIFHFYNDIHNWYPTWDDRTKLQVDYIKVWSL